MQTFYPVFESGQVLTNAHLNQMSAWLNEQVQQSRHKLFGIGIVCGLEPLREGNQVSVSGGVAVTSNGYLLTQDGNQSYTQCREYNLPVSASVENDNAVDAIEVPELLPDANVPMWELLTSEFEADAEGPSVQTLSASFLGDKVVMLLLEAKVQSLKNCDVNSCADKGARYQFTLRTLLVHENDARTLWQGETDASTELRPFDQNWQVLHNHLLPQAVEKLVVASGGLESLEQVHTKVQSIAASAWQRLRAQLQASFDVYGWILRERFPHETFPTDPWAGMETLFNTQPQNARDLFLNLHHYDLLQDVAASYNEFLEVAYEYNALCCPNPQRFPYHVFLGKAETEKVAQQPGNRTFASINFNVGAKPTAAELRHPFYPCPQLDGQKPLALRMQDLYYRTWLLLKRYRTNSLSTKALKILPSQVGGALSGKAIPYYLELNPADDLHRNWNPEFTRKGKLPLVPGYDVSSSNPHPLMRVPLEHDFYRVEGVSGKPLGQLIAELRLQKQQLGLSFAIEPVFIPVQAGNNQFSKASLLALLLKDRTLLRLFKCKLGDMDVIFLLLLAVVFQLLLTLVYLLARLRPSENQALSMVGPELKRFSVDESALRAAMEGNDVIALQLAADEMMQANNVGQFYLNQVRAGNLGALDLIDALDEDDDPNGAIAQVYQLSKKQASESLFERVRSVVGDDADDEQLQEVYHSARMMQQSEKLMAQVSVESIAQFEFDEFHAQIEELSSAHKELNQHANAQNNPEVQAVLTGVNSQMGLLGNLGKSALLTNMQEEFGKRIKSIFEEFMFDGYARKHPGLEHLCGVPKGGTLVLAYTHKTLLEKYTPPIEEPEQEVAPALAAALANNDAKAFVTANAELMLRAEMFLAEERVSPPVEARLASLVEAGRNDRSAIMVLSESVMANEKVNVDKDVVRAMASENPQFALANNAFELLDVSKAADEDDPLNDMVVVADFCLPTFCCDSDCSDLELATAPNVPPEQAEAVSVSVSGKIVAAAAKGALEALMRKSRVPLVDATLSVLDRDNKAVKVRVTRGSFLFKVKPGVYNIAASAPGYVTQEQEVQIGKTVLKDIVVTLDKSRGKGKTIRQ